MEWHESKERKARKRWLKRLSLLAVVALAGWGVALWLTGGLDGGRSLSTGDSSRENGAEDAARLRRELASRSSGQAGSLSHAPLGVMREKAHGDFNVTEAQRRRYEEYNKLGNKNIPPASPNLANAELGLAHVSILKELRVTPVGSDGKGKIDGVRVTGFGDDSLRSNAPLLDGDVIMKINNIPISSMNVMRDLVRDMDGSKGATLDVVRDGKPVVVLLVGR